MEVKWYTMWWINQSPAELNQIDTVWRIISLMWFPDGLNNNVTHVAFLFDVKVLLVFLKALNNIIYHNNVFHLTLGEASSLLNTVEKKDLK